MHTLILHAVSQYTHVNSRVKTEFNTLIV